MAPAIEKHPLGFFLPANTRLLMLGSFPPPKSRWSMDFYYPNFINDMWRIMGLIFYDDKNYFVETTKSFNKEKIVCFCQEKGIGIGDAALEVVRLKTNASDKFLEVVKPMDFSSVIHQIPSCEAIVVTGQKAMETLLSVISSISKAPVMGDAVDFIFENRALKLFRMPSSSRAYPMAIEKKAVFYRHMFETIRMISE